MRYVKNKYLIQCFSKEKGKHLREVEGYIIDCNGILFGLSKESGSYILTQIESGLAIPFGVYPKKRTLQGFIDGIPIILKAIPLPRLEIFDNKEEQQNYISSFNDKEIYFISNSN